MFVNWSAMFVKTVLRSSFGFSYVLFVAVVVIYPVNNVFRLTVYMMSDMSSFAGKIKCVTSNSVCYATTCQVVVFASKRTMGWVLLCGRDSVVWR